MAKDCVSACLDGGGGERRGADLVNEGSQEGKCHERGRRGRAASESLDPGKIPIFRTGGRSREIMSLIEQD